MDSLVNQAAKYWYLSSGQASVPLVVRSAVGAGGRFGAIHSQNPGPGCTACPASRSSAPPRPPTPGAAQGGDPDPNPVVFLEHKRLYSVKGELEDGAVRLGQAKIVRPGSDLTIVAVMTGVPAALTAADALAGAGIDAEVIDMRSLRPLDAGTVLESIGRTHRLLAVEEGPRTGGWAAGLLGAVAADALDELDDAWLLTTPDGPIPFSPPLEDDFLPGTGADHGNRPRAASGGGMTAFADGCAWIEGEYVPIAEARIPILDAGFVRSDLTYDVVGVWHGRFFRLDDHLTRLEQGCAEDPAAPPARARRDAGDPGRGRPPVAACARRTWRRSSPVASRRRASATRAAGTPRFYAYAIPYVWIVRPELQEQGTHVVVAKQTRRIPPDSVDPTVKNFHWGDLVRGLFEAYDRDAWLPILTDGEGRVSEGPGFNVFAVVRGELYTPELGVLEGITRRTTIEIAGDQGLAVHIGELPLPLLYEAEEIFLTSTAGGVMPVATLDGKPVGAGSPGRITDCPARPLLGAARGPRLHAGGGLRGDHDRGTAGMSSAGNRCQS